MRKRVFCLFVSLFVVMVCMFSYEVEYKGDTKIENVQLKTMQGELIEEIIQEETVSFEYPITPDDPEWKELGSVQNKIEACRIPADILDKMTDEQLVQAIIDFPFLYDVFLASTESAGVKSLERTCDAYRELLTRSKAKDILLDQIEYQLSVCATDVSAEQMLTNDALVVLILHQEDFAGELTTEDMYNLAELSSQIDISEEVQNGAQPYVVSAPQTPSGVSYYTYTCDHGPILYHEALDRDTINNYNVELVSPGSCKYTRYVYSKWGRAGVFEHIVATVPEEYETSRITVWSK